MWCFYYIVFIRKYGIKLIAFRYADLSDLYLSLYRYTFKNCFFICFECERTVS